jgi:hypothetical protein
MFVFGLGFGNDVIPGFRRQPNGGQDVLDISAFGITDLATQATITTGQIDGVGALDTQLTRGTHHITYSMSPMPARTSSMRKTSYSRFATVAAVIVQAEEVSHVHFT